MVRNMWPATNTCGVDGYLRIENPRLGEVEITHNYEVLSTDSIGREL